jgi:hypothetical protein
MHTPGLLVAGQHELDLRAAQSFDHVEILFAGNPKDSPDALVLERGNQEFGAVHQMRSFKTNLAGSRLRI